ncbi:MAG: DUF4260 domain-containing protein [Deltaproteobacteria bacterium]|jgi:hypothetical protein|nr:DUF4260 domain-containing protein [Deltaproteobacteria bacterium]MBW2497354.1 DUF4260 domain-containing protein [Deltaproteobacteria bacterium]
MLPIDPIVQRRIEATAMLAAAIVAYGHLGFSWGVFAACFFLPDLSIGVYLAGPKIGGTAYNCAHFFLWPLAIGAFGVLGDSAVAQQAALIWGAHIAFDRALGWGLKYERGFCHTDMGLKKLPFPSPFLEPQEGTPQ